MLNVNFVKVESSNIQEIGYLDNNLYVKYKSGTYVYENVDKSIYESLLSSDSKGRFMNENIKSKYNYKKL